MLGHSFGNDSNQLNKTFYNELLHIIGLEEVKDKGKKIISRKSEKDRDYASLLESTVFHLEDRDYLHKIQSIENNNEKAFNAGLELCLTWVNRILFLKLLESQLLAYHNNNLDYKFLNSKFINGYDDLNDLFFSALAKLEEDRHPRFKDKYQHIPYLNSSLFERSILEDEAFEISALNNDDISIYSGTVLKDAKGKKSKGKLKTLDYLFQFLDAYDFATDGNEGIEDAHETKSLINASVLGLIFEKINGYKEGSFYTPAYITMYMCRETLRRAILQKFKEQENDQIETFEDLQSYCQRYFKLDDLKRFNTIVNSLRICDPAVGSGHFLVSALNELIVIKNELGILVDAKGLPLRCDIEIVNDELYVIDDKGLLFEYNPTEKESTRIQHTLFHEKQTLIENCLFGVDINPNSVKICRLRLWIELLKNAYYTKENRLQTLPNIDINIKCGNSLISRFNLDDDLKDAFRNKKNPKLKYTFTDYKNAVSEYKDTNSKDRKREVLEIIEEVKDNFKSTLDNKVKKKFEDAQYEYNLKNDQINNLKQFGEKISKAEKDRLKSLKDKVEEAYLEQQEIVNNAIYHNAFEWRFEFPEVLEDDGSYIGFDAIIGNPPYVDLKAIQNVIVKYLFDNYKTSSNRVNLYSTFIERGYQILKTKGLFSYIIPNSILMSSSYQSLRNLIKDEVYKIIKLPEKVFDDATVETVIVEFQKSVSFDFCSTIAYSKNESLNEIENSLIYLVPKKSWQVYEEPKFNIYISQDILKVLNLVNSKGIPLNEISEFALGITPYDKYKGHSQELIKSKAFHSDSKISDLYKPLIKGKNITPYFVENTPSGYIKYGDWLGASREERFFIEPRVIVRQIVSGNPPKIYAGYTNQRLYFTQIGFSIIPKNTISSIELTALLNSGLINFYHKYLFLDIEKELFQKILIENCKKFPILPFTNKEQLESIVLKIISIKKENPKADITALEAEIDQMVYKLYGLTEEEIAIVENN
ncbi:Eco57I restriction-modification methylase domain-containing protein [Bizionia sp.]|uniref:type IIG restriction enzyme/methyltransferase n=1 Tax=Bizionia sp. TaxID=1954480 RepID=UPI003A958D6F